MLDKAIRELDRERMQLQSQEKKLVVEIKKMASQGQMVRGTRFCAWCSSCTQSLDLPVLPTACALVVYAGGKDWMAEGCCSQRGVGGC